MSEPLPTFRNNKDRAVYLLGEYKIPLSVMVLAAGVWAVYASPQLPDVPQSVAAFALASFVLALPTYMFGNAISSYLFPGPERIEVGIADPGTESMYRVVTVLPEVWESKTVVGAPPFQPEDGVDYVVTRFNWYDDIGELEVRGCEQADLEPGLAWENASRVDELYAHHHAVRRAYSQLKATVLRRGTEIHDLTLMKEMAEQEDATLAPGVSVTSMIEEMEDEIEDLPDAPEPDGRTQHQRRRGVDNGRPDDWFSDDYDTDLLREETNGHSERPVAADGGNNE
ncbi:hypothetical protein SAMN04487949_1880 [Halogranum gelatinilyticum]|uniref:Uncharacterized protein n=1 Tax=Halogranum gelatinilyticum TaxID=660521 RepID=A0A1G9TRJ6_9EURY|nr:hypothetical protein [Halogranum gelatinilyticum]SDM50313.1 hypothetical protein SAMN04487949_1880 [Halogranum gelatinilyticum]